MAGSMNGGGGRSVDWGLLVLRVFSGLGIAFDDVSGRDDVRGILLQPDNEPAPDPRLLPLDLCRDFHHAAFEFVDLLRAQDRGE